MGIRSFLLGSASAQPTLEAAIASPDGPAFPSYWGGSTLIPRTIARQTAVKVPEIKRARDLIAGTISSASLYREFPDGTRDEGPGFIMQPDSTVPRSLMIAETVADLFFDGISVWLVTNRYALDNRPSNAIHVPSDACEVVFNVLNQPTEVYVNGASVPLADCILFRHSADGILTTGADTIATGLQIEAAVKAAMASPMPNMKVKSMVDRDQTEVDALMAYYDEVVNLRASVYEGRNVELTPISWNPEQLGMASLRRQQSTALSRLTGVPAWYLSAESGDSMTYSSNLMARQDLYDLTFAPYIRTIEDTLTMVSVPRGQEICMDLWDFLNADPKVRADIETQLVGAGIMTIQEARIREDLIEEPNS